MVGGISVIIISSSDESCDIKGEDTMTDWFTIEEINDKTFAISEYKHWEEMHSYLLLGEKRALLIDSGLGIGQIKEVVSRLTDLPVDLVTTHVHWDHIGGHKDFESIYVHPLDGGWMKAGIPLPLAVVKKNISTCPDLPGDFDLDSFSLYQTHDFMEVRDYECFDLGNRKIRVIHTPGHSPGHICLFDEDSHDLYTGDLIYKGTLYCNYPSTDPGAFYESLLKVQALGVKRLLPAHHDLNLELGLLKDLVDAFEKIKETDGLHQGNGLYDFGDFKISM